jgi:acyl phosphate:glycerol-3-phosphate acyltransferase
VMTFVGGAFVLAPLAAAGCLLACLAASALGSFRLGARMGVFGFPLVQLLVDSIERVAATGALMTLIGLLYLVDRPRRTRATCSRSGREAREADAAGW